MSTTRAKRVPVAPGVYQDAYGFGVMASVGSGTRRLRGPELRFPPGTPLSTMIACWHREKMRLTAELAQAGDGPVQRGTLAADVRQYLDTALLSPQRRAEREDQLKWWCEAFGTKRRAELHPPDLRRALNGLLQKGRDGHTPLAASTVNKYRFALSHVFTVLDGADAANPLRSVPKYREPDAQPRDQRYEIIERILAEIRDRGQGEALSRTKAIARVLAYVPITPAQLRRLTRADVDWSEDGAIMIPGRRKGRGTRPITKSLWPEGLAALRAFDAADCWGKQFSRSSFHRIFTAARDRVVAALRLERPDLDLSSLESMRPYDLRHSLGTLASRVLKNEMQVMELLDHKDPRTTRRYTQGALADHMRDAGAAMAAAFATPNPATSLPPKPTPVPATPVTMTPRLRKRLAGKDLP